MVLTPEQCAIVAGWPDFPADWAARGLRNPHKVAREASLGAEARWWFGEACRTGTWPDQALLDSHRAINMLTYVADVFGLPMPGNATADSFQGRFAVTALKRLITPHRWPPTDAFEREIDPVLKQLGAYSSNPEQHANEQMVTASLPASAEIEAANARRRLEPVRTNTWTRLERERRAREDRERRERDQERTEPMMSQRLITATPGGTSGQGGMRPSIPGTRAGGSPTGGNYGVRPRVAGFIPWDRLNPFANRGPEKWTMLPRTATYAELSAASSSAGIPAGSVFGLLNRSFNGANWAVQRGNGWDVARNNWSDWDAIAEGLQIIKILRESTAMVPTAGGGELCGLPAGMASCGREPMMTQRRTCGRGWILAVDGKCYPKKMLARGMRMNDSRRAPVTHSDMKAITRAARAKRRLETLEKRVERLSKPRRRRTR